MKKQIVASVLLALFLCLFLSLNSKADVIFVGDSYGEGYTDFGYTENWCNITASYLNLETYYRFTKCGSGFKNGMTFTELLKNGSSQISDPNKIDYIILGGGYNDWRYTYSDIYDGMIQFINYARETFPNAKIYIAPIDYSWRIEPQTNIRTTVFAAYSQCEQYGVIYLKQFERLIGERKWFANDFVHPTLEGQKRIAKMFTILLRDDLDPINKYLMTKMLNKDYIIFHKGNNPRLLPIFYEVR